MSHPNLRPRLVCHLTIAFALAACAVPDYSSHSVAILHQDGRLHVRDSRSVRLLREVDLDQDVGDFHNRYPLAQSMDGRRLLVLTRADSGVEHHVYSIGIADDSMTSRRFSDNADYTAVAVGPSTGRIYLAGRSGDGFVVRQLDSRTLQDVAESSVFEHAFDGNRIERVMPNASESRLYVGYSWGRTAWLEVRNGTLFLCDIEADDAAADCQLPKSGYSAAAGDGLVAFAGMKDLYFYPPVGEPVLVPHQFDNGTTREVAFDRSSGRAIVAHPCTNHGRRFGRPLNARFVVAPVPGLGEQPARNDSSVVAEQVCADKISIEPEGRWAAITSYKWRGDWYPWTVRLVDLATGRRLRSLHTGGRPADVLVLR